MVELTPHQKKALNLDSHLSLTANAGSGKTSVLIKRYLEIAISRNIPLKEIAAITFTEKAASELYKKIAETIDNEYILTDNAILKKKLGNLRRQLISANISTIHSFCMNILREFPVEADIDVNFSPIDEDFSNELIEISVNETIKQRLKEETKSEQTKNLIRILGSYSQLSLELISLIKNRKNVLQVKNSIYHKTLVEIADHFDEKFLHYAEKIITPQIKDFVNVLTEVNNAALGCKSEFAQQINSLIPDLESKDIKEILHLLKKTSQLLLTKEGNVRKQKYLPGSLFEIYFDQINAIQDFFQSMKYFEFTDFENKDNLDLAVFGKEVIELFSNALAIYEKKKKDSGGLDFEDILLFVKKILENEEVRISLSNKYKYIMVDEYQDTNEVQYRIFLPILDYLNKNNLFIVGDEKQSIYMFRDAELQVFNQTKKDIVEKSGNQYLLTLPDSFRMSPLICAFTNYLFEKLFNEPNLLYNEVSYTPIICAKQEGLEGTIEFIFTKDEKENDVASETESKLVAKRIIELIRNEGEKKRLSWKDIVILCRKRKSFTLLEKEFTEMGIPYSVIGGKGFFQRQLIFDVYNYFSFLLNKENDSALVGILRSPFYSIPDSLIYEISLEEGYCYFEKLNRFAARDEKLKKIASQLEETLTLANTQSIINILRKITTETAILAVYSARRNGEQEFANYQKLVQLSVAFLSNGYKNLYDYVIFLNDAIEKIEGEGQPVPLDDKDSVKIMTIHQAKGLEFKAVFLFNCHEKELSPTIHSKEIIVNKEFGILVKLPPDDDFFQSHVSASIVKLNDYLAIKKNNAELKRLFYVAVTRAKNYLFISGTLKTRKSYSENSFIDLLINGLPIDLESESFSFSTNLTYLRKNEKGYYNQHEVVNVHIPIIKEIPGQELNSGEKIDLQTDVHINLKKINLLQSEEIISATKIAIFTQCPFKYQLTYETGFISIFEKFREWKKHETINKIDKIFEFNNQEELDWENEESIGDIISTKNYAAVCGRVIHSILEKDLNKGEILDYIKLSLEREFDFLEKKKIKVTDIEKDIFHTVDRFYRSDTYSMINSFNKYKNEFEAYLFDNDYNLYGIIDKIIFQGNSAIIIDYKTDRVQKDKLAERWNNYLYQLKFYAYLVCKLYPQIENMTLRLLFIEHPEVILSDEVNRADVLSFGKIIKDIVKKIRKTDFRKNLKHCSNCVFSDESNNCIV